MAKTFSNFLGEGKREQDKINEFLDKGIQNLTREEKALFDRLLKGGTLPTESKAPPVIKTDKTGNYLKDEDGRVITEPDKDEDTELDAGQEFTTGKGKKIGADKIVPPKIINARVYRNKDSEERFIYSYVTLEDADGGKYNDWIVYRTGGGREFGAFLDTSNPKFSYYRTTAPKALWEILDWKYDFGMMLDDDLYEDFTTFIELYKNREERANRGPLTALYRRLSGLL
jgi:hypothetical protein